ncbi:MAG: hypothetical protein GY826_43800 [Fuerstiella sp.]|nr:hypothetical protein [Fuerstiella sp.]
MFARAKVLLCLLIADFTQNWIPRVFRVIPVLWQFHAIHHSAEEMAGLFGTTYVPRHWPGEYGLCGRGNVPPGWVRQLLSPFRRNRQ